MNRGQTILLVDDGEIDLALMRIAFDKAKCNFPLQEVHDGEEAIAYLEGKGPFGDRHRFPLPMLMMLDINMPKMDGFAVLAWVRANPVLRCLSTIIMSASMRPEDVSRAYHLGANAFLVKPSSLEALITMVKCLDQWITINRFPPLSVQRVG